MELNAEMQAQNKEAAKAEMEFNKIYAKLSDEARLNFSKWLSRREVLDSKRVNIRVCSEKARLIQSTKILKKKADRLKNLCRELRGRKYKRRVKFLLN